MITSSALQAFRAIDADGSGGISSKELQQGQLFGSSALRSAIAKDGADKTFKAMDADNNGSLSQQELSDGLTKLSPDIQSILLAAQEQESQSNQFLNGLKVSAYSTLPALAADSSTGNTALNILKAYYQLA